MSEQQTPSSSPGQTDRPARAGGRRRHLRRLLVALAVTAIITGGVTWYAYFHVFKAGFAEVVPGQVYRSPQPSPDQLRAYVSSHGIRTVICLRGDKHRDVVAARATAEELGVTFVTFRLNSGKLPTREEMLELITAIEESPKPILIHCANNVDRSGMAATVAALLVGRVGLDAALGQLPLLRANKDDIHVSDILGQFKAYCEQAGADRDDPAVFKQWVAEQYTAEPLPDTQLVPRIPFWPK